ncbi:hypothetical protein CIG11343_0592 [Campylobacter iguaniorum]|uniref:hypothetical protein n=1 Tax=Campylobacter iguaniorum TaxID=1244531 RepID=UPI0007C9238A|nr:hypothetical protein [Campylobacter iguaniorum]ANE35653.1 hypothetical protein CIG11343_0592 [Campylobacter iguaniorum]
MADSSQTPCIIVKRSIGSVYGFIVVPETFGLDVFYNVSTHDFVLSNGEKKIVEYFSSIFLKYLGREFEILFPFPFFKNGKEIFDFSLITYELINLNLFEDSSTKIKSSKSDLVEYLFDITDLKFTVNLYPTKDSTTCSSYSFSLEPLEELVTMLRSNDKDGSTKTDSTPTNSTLTDSTPTIQSDLIDFSGKFGNFEKNTLVTCTLYPNLYFKVKNVTILQTSFNLYTFSYCLQTMGKFANNEMIEDKTLQENLIFAPLNLISRI